MGQSLTGKVAVITGASSGIGWALAKALAAEGCAVGLVARREELLKSLTAEIATSGNKAAYAVGDARNRDSIGTAIASLRTALGPIDLAIANAGVGKATLLDPVNVADVENMFRVNVLGVIYTFAAVMPEMLARKTGRLVAISSLAAYRGLPGESAYCASKAAVNTYMDGLRIHLRGTGVSATTICPGFVITPMTADFKFHMPGLMTAERAALRIVKAIKSGKKVANFPWRLNVLTKISRWVPDAWVNWMMGDYNEESKKQLI
jgi:short-subunit dehydrogenase